MYTIYADGNLLYSPDLAGDGFAVYGPRLTLELNKAGSLEFTMPDNNVMYDQLRKLKTVVTAYQNGEEIFRGRVLHDEKDFYKQRKTYCEGELSFLLDSKQRPYTSNEAADMMFKKYIENHNARVDDFKKFKVGIISANIDQAVDPDADIGSEIVSVELSINGESQYVRDAGDAKARATTSFGNRHLVGSSHYSGFNPDGTSSDNPTDFYEVWMRYEITMPKTCNRIDFKANASKFMNSAAIVQLAQFRYSVGSKDAPGDVYTTFYWDTSVKSMSGSVNGVFREGETIYLWLHFNLTGINCYAEGVSIASITGYTHEYETYAFASDDYVTTLNEIQDKLINRYGGYLNIRDGEDGRYIDWLSDSGGEIGQTIEFGVNLIDISEYITAENIYTVLIPIGASAYDDDGKESGKVNITGINNGADYIENKTAISLFGRIEEKVEWNYITDPNQLMITAEGALNRNIELAVTLTAKAVDLHMLDIKVEQIHLGDRVRVVSLPHGLNALFQCTKITYDFMNPENNEYVFGVETTSLTEKQVSGEKQIQNSANIVQTAVGMASVSAGAASQANASVQTVIAQLPSEYVQTSVFEAYKTETNAEIDALVARIVTLEGGTT